MSPIQVASQWVETFIVGAQRVRFWLLVIGAAGTALGGLAAGAGATVTAWRAAGLPSVATEAYVDKRIDEKLVPIAATLNAINGRSIDALIDGAENRRWLMQTELFKLQQIDLSKLSDPIAKTTIENQIKSIADALSRNSTKLEDLKKLRGTTIP